MKQIEQYGNKQKQFKVTPNPVHEKLFNEIVDGVVAEIIKESGADKHTKKIFVSWQKPIKM